MRRFIVSASYTQLLFDCPWPFGREDVPRFQNEAMAYGTDFHSATEALLNGKTVEELTLQGTLDPEESPATSHACLAFPTLQTWLSGENEFGIDFLNQQTSIRWVEKAVAYNPVTDEARFCAPVDENHEYPDRKPGEIPGTVDFAVDCIAEGTLLVMDHKTNHELPEVGSNPQLLTLACALAKIRGANRVIVAINHAPKGDDIAMSQVYASVVSREELATHRQRLIEAMGMIGRGFMRPGSTCTYCPANSICPSQGNQVLSAIVLAAKSPAFKVEKVEYDLTQPEGRGRVHFLLQTYGNILDHLRAALRLSVKQLGPGIRGDGKVVEIVPTTRKQLSQAGIIRALGPVEGKALIQELDLKGCIETVTREELRAVKE